MEKRKDERSERFYNLEGIGDTLIVALQDITLENRTFDRKGDVARVYDRESNETAGFNIFNASSYLEVKETGNPTLTKELVEKINEILAKNGFEENSRSKIFSEICCRLCEAEKRNTQMPDKLKASV